MALDQALVELPAVSKSVEDMTLRELLQDTAHNGLKRIRDVVMWPVDKDDIALSRLVSDASLSALKLLARLSEADMRHSVRNELIDAMAGRIAELEGKLKEGR